MDSEKIRFTFISNKEVVSKIRMLSYLSGSKIGDEVEKGLISRISDWEKENNVVLDDVMKLKDNLSNSNEFVIDLSKDEKKK